MNLSDLKKLCDQKLLDNLVHSRDIWNHHALVQKILPLLIEVAEAAKE